MDRYDPRALRKAIHSEDLILQELRSRIIAHEKEGKNPRKLKKAYKRHKAEKARLVRQKRMPLRLRAYLVAESLVGVMEQGGNNAGPMVERIIRANQGVKGEPWCGDFMAYCYRLAGSKRVVRAWAAVRLIRGLLGIRATSHPLKGDLVRFNFDHVGMFVSNLGGEIQTIEGNTGATGAVSDSRTGGDGVYEKRRAKSLVRDYLRVTG